MREDFTPIGPPTFSAVTDTFKIVLLDKIYYQQEGREEIVAFLKQQNAALIEKIETLSRDITALQESVTSEREERTALTHKVAAQLRQEKEKNARLERKARARKRSSNDSNSSTSSDCGEELHEEKKEGTTKRQKNQ
jgi:predicted ATP-grasp superfamily ATP-dependent carboligase